MNPICVKHILSSGHTEEHRFSSMSNALDFIHILHGEYNLREIVFTFDY